MTEDLLNRLPVLSQVFDQGGSVVSVDCAKGRHVFEVLAGEGAGVVLLDQPTGHNVYLNREGTTHRVSLQGKV